MVSGSHQGVMPDQVHGQNHWSRIITNVDTLMIPMGGIIYPRGILTRSDGSSLRRQKQQCRKGRLLCSSNWLAWMHRWNSCCSGCLLLKRHLGQFLFTIISVSVPGPAVTLTISTLSTWAFMNTRWNNFWWVCKPLIPQKVLLQTQEITNSIWL